MALGRAAHRSCTGGYLVATTDDEPRLRGYYESLSEGGTVTMTLERAVWGDTFGMLVDRFGISWLVNISNPQ